MLTPPTRLRCLRCQLTGRRNLLCSKAESCKDLPHAYWVGPVALGAWVLTVIAFLVSLY